jgi:eukaryotic-like serine/threonine-protein kinase
MTISPGTKFGPYEILAPLGAGGMGEVYRARDTRLGRDVAIKVLPQHLSANPEVRARFEREAMAISSLNHPHICTLHDVGREGDTHYLVMELVEGETLADRLAKGPLPLDQMMKFGAEIADALAKAHRAGIVHRDLKPGNVMLTKSGSKLLDFGLARTAGMGTAAGGSGVTMAELSQSPTMSRPLTAEGTIVGTFQYMAPEQLEGKESDPRSDIWALGATLYEMATGRKAFEGKSQASLISSIMKDEPRPLTELLPLTPPALDRIIRRCLAKDPDERWQSALDIASELRWISSTGSQTGVRAAAEATSRGGKPRRVSMLAAAGWILALAALGWIAFRAGQHSKEQPFYASVVPAPLDLPTEAVNGPIALSPDGTRLATTISRANVLMISIYDFSSGNNTVLESTNGAGFPFWSPDSRWIGFFADGKLKKVEAGGGPAQTLADAQAGRGGSWSSAGTIVFAPDIRGPLMKISENGGAASAVTQPATEEVTHRNPVFLPDGTHFLFIERKSRSEAFGRLMAGSIDGSAPREVLEHASNSQFAEGHLLFVRDRSLLAQQFDPKRLALSGAIVPIAENVAYNNPRDIGDFSASPAGLLAFRHEALVESTPGWFDREGRLIEAVGAAGLFNGAAVSRDLKQMALTRSEPSDRTFDIWIVDTTTKKMQRATFTKTPSSMSCAFSPGGTRIAVSSGNVNAAGSAASALWVQPVFGARTGSPLLESTDFQIEDWSPDGTTLIGYCQRTVTGFDITTIRLDDPKHELHDFVASPSLERGPRFSPDGRWVVYASNESGRFEVYVVDFPNAAVKLQVSREGGTTPIWSTDGSEIVFRQPPDAIMAAPVSRKGDPIEVGSPVRLGLSDASTDAPVAADGKRFLVLQRAPGANNRPVQVIRNWAARLEAGGKP